MRMQGKVALVTGGNLGIGRGIVHRLIGEGAVVAFCGRDEAKGAAVEGEIADLGGTAAFRRADVAVEDAAADLVTWAAKRFGRLDVVVNNAGVGSRRCGVEPSDSPGVRWAKLRGPNLDAAYYVSAHALPVLAATGGGAMVNISSTATWHGNWGSYGIAKAGNEGLTRSFAAEGGPFGIRVNGVSPGWITTDQDHAAPASGSADGDWAMPLSLLGRMGVPGEIAAAVLFLASDEASFVTGQTLIVDGGMMVMDYPSAPLLEGVGDRLYSRGSEG